MKKTSKIKQSLVTPINSLQANRRYRKTAKGLITNLYHKIKERNNSRSSNPLPFNISEFRAWVLSNPKFDGLYKYWVKSGYKHDFRPSVDRINCLEGYHFSNMQIITAKENRVKGEREKLILWGKVVYQSTLDGRDIAVYQSIKEAWLKTGISRNNISSVCNGKRKYAGGFKWHF